MNRDLALLSWTQLIATLTLHGMEGSTDICRTILNEIDRRMAPEKSTREVAVTSYVH